MEIFLCIFYTLLFLLLIRRMKFFRLEGLGTWTPSIFFLLKIAAGLTLWALYTFYYTDTSTADIYKYFHDSKIMHDALWSRPGDYFRMLFGIANDTPEFDALYYQQMNHWYREFDSNLYNDSHTIIRFNAFVRLFSFGYFNVHTVFMCFLSFAGLCALYKTFHPFLEEWKRALAFSVFLFPSVLFWGSGVLKEGLLFFGLGFLLYHFFGWLRDRRAIRWLWMLGFLLLLFATKFYILVSVLPALLAALWIGLGKPARFAPLKYLLVLALYITAGLFTDKIFPGYDPLEVLSIKQRDFLNLARGGTYLLDDSTVAYVAPEHRDSVRMFPSGGYGVMYIQPGTPYYYWRSADDFKDTIFVAHADSHSTRRHYSIMSDYPRAGSLMDVEQLKPELRSFLKNTPVAVWNSLARPYPWEARSLLLLMPALENIFLFLAFVLCLVFFKTRGVNWELVCFCLVFAFLLFAITGLTTPVIGALVRYRIPGIPFLLIAMLLMCDREKLLRRVPFLKRLII